MMLSCYLAGDGDVEWFIGANWPQLALLVMLAVGVLVLSQTAIKRGSGEGRRTSGRRLDFDLDVARMSQLRRSDIAQLQDGPSRIEGVIRSATETLGGDAHPVVYFNRADEGRDTAVAAQLVLVGDDTGQAALMHLDQARVIAAPESGPRHERICLRLGDTVEVLGTARRERETADSDNPSHARRVYATLGADAPIQVRQLRSALASDDAPSTSPTEP
ncbi:MAG: hypothetical protein ACPHRO_13985 [Nannocystaceae bacterium]